MKLGELLRNGAASLRAAGIDGAERDVRWLMAYTSGLKRDRLTLHMDLEINTGIEDAFNAAIIDRVCHRPVSKIVGYREFFGRKFVVAEWVLDPRPETELLVSTALEQSFQHVLDLGTGSGAILVTLLAERAKARGVGTDISEDAILTAEENAANHGVADRILLSLSDWWDDVAGQYDLIVSNPPYIAASEMADLSPEVRDYDPHIALTDGGDGLGAYRAITAEVSGHLTPGGRVLLEIGPTQAGAVSELLGQARLENIAVHPDLDGRDRVVSANMPL